MKYGVLNFNDGVALESIEDRNKFDDFEKARAVAIALSNWNIECAIIDLESGEELKHFMPYKTLFEKTGAAFQHPATVQVMLKHPPVVMVDEPFKEV